MLYDPGIDLLSTWGVDTFEALLLDPTYAFDPTDTYVDDVVAKELTTSGYVRSSITDAARNVDIVLHRIVYGCDDLDFATPDAGDPYQYAVLYRFVSDDSDSLLVACFDFGGVFTTDGNPLAVPVTSGVAYADDVS